MRLMFSYLKFLGVSTFYFFVRHIRAIRPTQEIANRPCFAPNVKPGPKSIHSPSFIFRIIFSMFPLVFLVYVACENCRQKPELHRG